MIDITFWNDIIGSWISIRTEEMRRLNKTTVEEIFKHELATRQKLKPLIEVISDVSEEEEEEDDDGWVD